MIAPREEKDEIIGHKIAGKVESKKKETDFSIERRKKRMKKKK